jgi:hemerythrin-like domain-containing protein
MNTRRKFLVSALATASGLIAGSQLLVSCSKANEEEVTANEDLMREHGVLRRALLVYFLTARKLRANPQDVRPQDLQQTASLFRKFGEDYHERALEEPFIFPAVKRTGGEASAYIDVLLAQHQRGREITDYILASTNGQGLASGGDQLVSALDSFVLMYQEHTAREDTIVFPAWHKSMGEHDYHEMGEKFEEIEHKQFGKDGFDDAVKQIAGIEQSLGIADLAQFTATPPPKVP